MLRPDIGVAVAGVAVDTMLASYTLDPARADHGWRGWPRICVGAPSVAASRSSARASSGRLRPGRRRARGAVAGERAGLIASLGPHLGAAIVTAGEQTVKLYDEIELPLSQVLAQVERRGILLDVDGSSARPPTRRADPGAAPEHRGRGRHAVRSELAQAAREVAVRRSRPAGQEEDQDRLQHRRRGARGARAPSARRARSSSTRAAHQAQGHLPRRAADAGPPRHRAHPHPLQPGGGRDRAGCRRTDPNLQNIPIRTELGRRSAAPSSRRRAACCSRPTTRRSSCGVLAHLSGRPGADRGVPHGRRRAHAAPRRGSSASRRGRGADEQRARGQDDQLRDHLRPERVRPGPRQLGIPRTEAAAFIERVLRGLPGVRQLHGRH